MLADRIRAAFADVQRRLQEQQELLSGVMSTVDEFAPESDTRVPAPGSAEPGPAAPEPPAPGTQPIQTPGEPVAPPGDGTTTDPDDVVQGNVSDVSKYLAEKPEDAALILDAENRRVEAVRLSGKADEQPRAGVIRAVEAAAAHSAS